MGPLCGSTFQDLDDAEQHLRGHIDTMCRTTENEEKVFTCYFGSCVEDQPPTLSSQVEQLGHIWSQHFIWWKPCETPRFCYLCHCWLLRPREWEWHADIHLDEVHSLVSQFGYDGDLSSGRFLAPRICPICFHDETRPASERIFFYNDYSSQLRRHLHIHFEAMGKISSSQTCPCAPSMCTESGKMDAVQMRKHLIEVHRIESAKTPVKRSKRKGAKEPLIDTSGNEEPRKLKLVNLADCFEKDHIVE